VTKASDNAFPSILITESAEPSAPAAGKQRLYIDSTTKRLKRTNSSGADVNVDLPGGSAFPASPATGDLFDRTDLGLIFFWDGTRWLSRDLYQTPFLFTTGVSVPISATANNATRMPAPALQGGSDIWIVTHSVRFVVNSGGTALGASHKWVGTPHTYDSALSAANITTVNIDSGSSAVYRLIDTAIGALMNNGSAKYALMTTWTKTGTPGTLDMMEALSYRIVAT
jgi:hypothetical protein